MDLLLITIALLAVTLITWIDRVRFGTYFTPAVLLGVPYMGVSLLAYVIGPPQGYVPLYTPSVIVWIGYLALFWIMGHLATFFIPDATLHVPPPLDEDAARPTALIIAWLAIPILAYGTWSAAGTVGLEAFQEAEYREMVLWGFMGHVLIFSIPAFIYLVGAARRGNLKVCGGTAILLLILFALRPTKSWVLLPIVAGLLCRIRTTGFRFPAKGVAISILAMYGLFNVTYLITFSAANSSALADREVYKYLFVHAEDYLFAGVLGFSGEMLKGNAYPPDHAAVYANLMNLGSLITGDTFVTGVESNYTVIRPGADGFKSNVHTLFGMLVMCIGYEEAAIYTVILSILTHGIFVASLRSRDVWISTIWCFIGACLAFGWFSTYFSHLPVLQIPTFCLFILAAERTFRWRSRRRIPLGGQAVNA